MGWSYDQFLDTLTARQELIVQLGLERMVAASARLRHPEHRLPPVIHVAGTNGKGSTIAFLRSLLGSPHCRVATYTSPHLCDLRERMQCDGISISPEEIAQIGEEVACRCHDIPLTYFEYLTLIAFQWMTRDRCDCLLCETGLGGRLDATNIVQPVLTVLTPIAQDHAAQLGTTLVEIAREKCGIVKPGIPVVSAPQRDTVRECIRAASASREATVLWAVPVPASVPLGLAGAHQRINAGVAMAAAQWLRGAGWNVASPGVLGATRWDGRCEWLSTTPPILYDVAHNPHGMAAVIDYLRTIVAGRPVTVYLGSMRDKPIAEMVAVLVPFVDQVVAVALPSARAIDAEALAALVREHGCAADVCSLDGLPERLQRADSARCHLVTGTHQLYAVARSAV
ncbi:MAG: bifunctional folylpolyglutamate synthase/dihydrofolate synthase [Deltaproteobacteria bacterium]|nr:bifunctional folylpolyglutamate synthase/dihydrofolate synthase [Deltaproteobacteria bacterium]